MAFASMEGGSDGEPNAEINMIPFIDVMLVLLVIFIVTAPLLTHSVKVQLPRASSTIDKQEPAPPVRVSIDGAGTVFWGGDQVDPERLQQLVVEAAKRDPVPELQLRADKTTSYEHVAKVMAIAARNGLTRIGFVTDPRE